MIGRTNTGGGGGGGLNFKVVGGTTAPSSPKENMIWINTSSTITDWVFSATQPTSATGRVWISIDTSSTVEFNALKKNGIQVYPISTKQYVSGKWVDKETKSYRDGEWVDWLTDVYLYNTGDECTDVTGGWTAKAMKLSSSSSATAIAPTVTRNSTNLHVKMGSANRSGIVYAKKPVNLSGYSTLKATGSFKNGSTSNNAQSVCLHVWSDIGQYATSNTVASALVNYGTTVSKLTIDVSSLAGEHYVGFFMNTSGDGGSSYVQMETCQLLK